MYHNLNLINVKNFDIIYNYKLYLIIFNEYLKD